MIKYFSNKNIVSNDNNNSNNNNNRNDNDDDAFHTYHLLTASFIKV